MPMWYPKVGHVPSDSSPLLAARRIRYAEDVDDAVMAGTTDWQTASSFGSNTAFEGPLAREIEMTSPLSFGATSRYATPLAVPEEGYLARYGIYGLMLLGGYEAYKHRSGLYKALKDDVRTMTHPFEDIKETILNMFDPLHIFHHRPGQKPASKTDSTPNTHPNRITGDGHPQAPALKGYPNSYTVARGTPLVTS